MVNTADMVERLKDRAVKVGIQGVKAVVDGTVAAVKAMDRLQELLPKRGVAPKAPVAPQRTVEEPDLERPIPARPVMGTPVKAKAPRPEARLVAERVLVEAHAVEERLKDARPARRPLKVVGLEEEKAPAKRRTQGRKVKPTAAAPAARRAKASTNVQEEGFKAKRGQKHRH